MKTRCWMIGRSAELDLIIFVLMVQLIFFIFFSCIIPSKYYHWSCHGTLVSRILMLLYLVYVSIAIGQGGGVAPLIALARSDAEVSIL